LSSRIAILPPAGLCSIFSNEPILEWTSHLSFSVRTVTRGGGGDQFALTSEPTFDDASQCIGSSRIAMRPPPGRCSILSNEPILDAIFLNLFLSERISTSYRKGDHQSLRA